MSLTFVEPSSAPPTLNVVLYGAEGSGKTWGALSAPGPILYLNAEGSNAVADAREHFREKEIREVVLDRPQVLDDAELYLRDGGDGERSVVLDSLSSAYQALVDFYSNRGKPSLPNYGDAGLRIERFCRFLRDLPLTAVAVAHEIAVKDEATGGFERMPYTGSSNPGLGVRVMAMYDVVGYCARVQPADATEPPRWLAQVVAGNGRRGKNRGAFLANYAPVDLTAWLAQRARRNAAAAPIPNAAEAA